MRASMQHPDVSRPQRGDFPNRFLRMTPTRSAVCGRFGRPTPRTMGAWLFYVSLGQPFRIKSDTGPARSCSIALVEPWTVHQVSTEDSDIAMLMIEPESVDGDRIFRPWFATPSRMAGTHLSMLRAFSSPPAEWIDFDLQFFGSALPERALDPRIRKVVDMIYERNDSDLSIDMCAAHVCLSPSRLMHLFQDQLGTSFRRFRGWRRARSLLHKMGKSPALVQVALDMGYSDSTHLSKSTRSWYGYTPTTMFRGSRQFSVIATM